MWAKNSSSSPPQLPVERRAHHHGGSRRPCHRHRLARGVVLSPVFLQRAHDPAPAVGIAVAVDQSTRRAGIFKQRGVLEPAYLGLAGARRGCFLHETAHRTHPSRRHLDVGIEKHHKGIVHLPNGEVVAPGEAVVLAKVDGEHIRMVLRNPLQRAVGRTVVGNDEVGVGVDGTACRLRQETPEQIHTVPVEYYYATLFHIGCCALHRRPQGHRSVPWLWQLQIYFKKHFKNTHDPRSVIKKLYFCG